MSRPSSESAVFAITNGKPVTIHLLNATFSSRHSSSKTPVVTAIYVSQEGHSMRYHIENIIGPLLDHVPANCAFGKSLRLKLAERWDVIAIAEDR